MESRSAKRNARAAGFAIAFAIGIFVSLSASVYARDMAEVLGVDRGVPFVEWLPAGFAPALCIMAAFAVIAGVFAYLVFARFDSLASWLARCRPAKRIRLAFARRDIVIAALCIGVLWIPVIAVCFPGCLTVDTYDELYQYQTAAPTYYSTASALIDAEIVDHHPWFDTLLYGWFWQIGALLGSQAAGIFLFVIVQCVVLAGCLGASVCYLERLGVPYPLRLAALLFCALFPIIPLFAATVVKDSTYLMFYLPWFILWLEAARTRGALFGRRGCAVAFFALGILCALSKKTGIVLLAICLIILVARMRGRRLALAGASIACLLASALVLPAIAGALVGGIAPGGRQEALSPAIQQVVGLIREDPGALADTELEAVDAVIDVERALARFEPYRADGAKDAFRQGASSADVARFLGVWAGLGLRHPDSYAYTTVLCSGMLYIPFMKMEGYLDNSYLRRVDRYEALGTGFAVDIVRPEGLVAASEHLFDSSALSAFADLPVVSLFFTSGFYGGLIPFFAVVAALFARGRTGRRAESAAAAESCGSAHCEPLVFLGLAPVIVGFALLFVCPVASPRYVLSLLFSAPLILGWAWLALSRAR